METTTVNKEVRDTFKNFIINNIEHSLTYSKIIRNIPNADPAVEDARVINNNFKKNKFIDAVALFIDAISYDNPGFINKINDVIESNKKSVDSIANHCVKGDIFKKQVKRYKKIKDQGTCKSLGRENNYMMFSNFIRQYVNEDPEASASKKMAIIGSVWKNVQNDKIVTDALTKACNQLNQFKSQLSVDFEESDKSDEVKENIKNRINEKRNELLSDQPCFQRETILRLINGESVPETTEVAVSNTAKKGAARQRSAKGNTRTSKK